jgi:hypothetical protein
MAYVFGSPERYTGKDIAEAHQRLIDEKGLNETHFDIVIEHFKDTLKELDVPDVVTEQAVDILMTSRPVFERRPTEKDLYGAALKLLKEYKNDAVRDLRDVRSQLSGLGVREEGQLQLLRGAVRARSGGEVQDDADDCMQALLAKERGR